MNRALATLLSCVSGALLASACGGTVGDNGSAGTGSPSASRAGSGTTAGGASDGATGSTSGSASGSTSGRASSTAASDDAGAGDGDAAGPGTPQDASTSHDGGSAGDAGAPGDASVSSGGDASVGGGGALIQNDTFWKDTSGNFIYSQGGGVLQVGGTYYWYGVHYAGADTYAAAPSGSNSNTTFVGVTVYSSTDLAHWKFEGNALTAASVQAAVTFDSSTWIGRVGATYNATTKKYVLNGQYLGTPNTEQFFATSDTPAGPFTWAATQAVITNVTNNNCGDQSVFNDDDGAAYLICSSLNGRSNLYVAPFRASDSLSIDPATKVFGGSGREGNVMFKYSGHYYFCSSDLHGWNASHTYCISATNVLGPYSAEAVMGNTDLDFSHVTQTGLFVHVKGTAQDTIVFGGDRWADFAGNGIGFNQWVPLTFNGTAPVMQSLSQWSIDATTGTWSAGPGNNYVLNPSFEADRVATNPPEGWTTSGGADVTGGHTGRFAWQLSATSSVSQAIPSLPDGTYTLSAWAKASASGGQLYAKGFGGTDKTATIASSSSWTKVSIAGIAVTNGQCQVGASSSGQTVTLDDLALSQQ